MYNSSCMCVFVCILVFVYVRSTIVFFQTQSFKIFNIIRSVTKTKMIISQPLKFNPSFSETKKIIDTSFWNMHEITVQLTKIKKYFLHWGNIVHS